MHKMNMEIASFSSIAVYIKNEFPNASSWPNVGLSVDDFFEFTAPLTHMSTSRAFYFAQIVTEEEINKYENFSYDFCKFPPITIIMQMY